MSSSSMFRGLLLLLLLVSPWPFGSVPPLASSALSATVYLLFASCFIVKGSFPRTAAPWAVAGLLLVGFQLLPLPSGLLALVSPASAAIHVPDEPAARAVLEQGARPTSVEPFATEVELYRMGALLLAFYLAGHLFGRGRPLRLFAYAATALGVALSLFAVYQQARWGTELYGRFPVPSATPFGPFVNHNHFAGLVEMCALVALGAAIGHLGRRGSPIPLLTGGAALLMGVALVASRSRGGVLAALAGLAVLAALALRDRRAARVGSVLLIAGCTVAVSAILFLAAPSGILERIGSIARPRGDVSMQFRLGLWFDSLRLFRSAPWVGTGLGTYAAVVPGYRTDLDETRAEFAESDLVQLACEAGLAGLLIAAGFLAVCFRNGWRRIGEETSEATRGILMGATAAVAALLVHGAYDFNTHIPSNALLFASLLGILAAPGAVKESENPPRPLARAARAVLVGGGCLFAATAVFRAGYSQHLADRVNPFRAQPEEFAELSLRLAEARRHAPRNPATYYREGYLFNEEAYRSPDSARYRELRFLQARAAFERAVRLAPARGAYWFELAWTLGNQRQDRAAGPLFEHALRLEPAWSRLRANYALYLASRGRIEDVLAQLEIARKLEPGLSPYEAVSIIGPYVNDRPEILRRAAGNGEESSKSVERYLGERATDRE